ncbi:MAG: ribosome maturation factor RimP [Clostridia bacterium]|nr:ribosome maturation factor RimP [Clostridia bacterium]
MQQKELLRRVREACLPLCAACGVSLWDVTFEKEGPKYTLTVYIDRPEGVFVEDCEKISRALDPVLDGSAFDSLPNYTLSVSSAGLERTLRRPEHFEWGMGKSVEVTFYRSRAGARTLCGTLDGADEETVTVSGERIPRAEIAAVRIRFEF